MQIHDDNDIIKNKKSTLARLDMHQWSILVKQWDQTKESQQAYCKRLNLNINTFSYVRAKIKQGHTLAAKFIPVTVQSHEPITDEINLLIFENKQGIKLKIPVSIKESVLLKVLKLIGWSHA